MKRLFVFPLTLFSLWFYSAAPDEPIQYDITSGAQAYDYAADTIHTGNFFIIPLNVNLIPPSSGVQFYKDGIVYLGTSKAETNMTPGHLSFGKTEAKYAELTDNAPENTRNFLGSGSFLYPCEAVTFTSDYNTMYYTGYSKTEGSEKIYQAKYTTGAGEGDRWAMEEKPLSFCTGQYIYTHPALSPDAKIMVFASNRPGSHGGMDLFISQFAGGAWSAPENIGDAVNSFGDELYPFIDSDYNLFFSSNGLMGYGGYDIFVCKFKGNTWEKPVNLSTPVNTIYDDIAFKISRKDNKTALYTVRQRNNPASMQLYKISMIKLPAQDKLLSVSQYFTSPNLKQNIFIVKEPPVEATNRGTETERSRSREGTAESENIIYRVQILTSFNPKTRSQITIGGKEYSIYEYLYSGAYRLCVGEFTTLSQAKDLQSLLVRNNYPQATVVVFKNNVRSFDPELLKDTGTIAAAERTTDKAGATETQARVQTTELKVDTEIKEIPRAEPARTETTKTEPAKQDTPKVEPVKPAVEQQAEASKDIVTYRVQIASNSVSKPGFKVTINNKVYNTFEYYYSGSYRLCVGEFTTLTPAKDLQNTCRKFGYPQAFVVAFKNNVRSTDPALFK